MTKLKESSSRSTLAGWREVIDQATPRRPDGCSWAEYQAMPPEEQEEYHRARLDWLSRGFRINTPELRLAQRQLRRRLASNARKNAAEAGIIITGPAHSGKTTIAQELGRQTENRRRAVNPDYRTHGIVPVVFIDAPSNSSGKGLLERIYLFFSPFPAPTRTTTSQYHSLVVDLLRHQHVELLIIDEAHLVASRHDANGDPTDTIKLIQNQTLTTVMLAGVDMLSQAVFGTSRGLQVVARADTIAIPPYSLTSSSSRKAYRGLIATFDAALPLIEHSPGMLTSHYQQIFDVTHGIIGNVARLFEDLVLDILEDPDRPHEHVTAARLNTLLRNRAALSGATVLLPTPPKGGPPTAKDGR